MRPAATMLASHEPPTAVRSEAHPLAVYLDGLLRENFARNRAMRVRKLTDKVPALSA